MGLDKNAPIGYIQRTREYYLGLGYDNPYQWANFTEVPFVQPVKALAKMRIAIVTTAAPYQPEKGDQGPGAAYNASAKFFAVYQLPIDPAPDLRISHIAIDRAHTTAEDSGTYLPLAALKRAQESGIIGSIAPHIYGFPTNRSQRANIDNDAPQLVKMLQADKVDAIIAIPNCPVCHQSVSIAARAAEDAGISSVIMGCALDIVQHAGAPRFYFPIFHLAIAVGARTIRPLRMQLSKGRLICLSGRQAAHQLALTPEMARGGKLERGLLKYRKTFRCRNYQKAGRF